ncbi:hypothetical protein [Pseudomonas sp. UFMG81]|uniref:hypothetical protein n=1 Tax=Pseudomonas sp. UFMG81 TaxID=2745936 RepID=UPI00188DECDC|nr:hypothetical protein [Pseudomonas sp. UFMG81]
MLDLIYIVDEDCASATKSDYKPNFVLPGRETSSPLVTTAALVLPTPLIISALLGVPSLMSLFNKDSNTPETDDAERQQAELLAQYVERHSISPSQARAEGYSFQPGHPVVGKTYRKHPLTGYDSAGAGKLYIPSDSYDSILLEERESELIKLLVHLGAVKITITKKASDNTTRSVSAGVSAQAGPAAGGGLSYQGNSERTTDNLDTREFVLEGRSWRAGSAVEQGDFFWLAYEPSWKAVVFAREQGGCLSASLEIKESTSFSSDKNLEMSVKAKVVEAKAQAGLKSAGNEEKTYYVKAEFAPIARQA